MTDEAPESAVTRLLDELLEGAEAVDTGAFTLDEARAVEKLTAFAYPDRTVFLAPFVEALIGLGAETVALREVGPDLELAADGDGFGLHDATHVLLGLYGRFFAPQETPTARALARLAVGIDMALGHEGIESVVVACADGGGTLLASYRRGDEPVLSRKPDPPAQPLRVIVDRNWKERLKRGPNEEELAHLRRVVEFSPAGVSIEGSLVSRRRRAWGRTEQGRRDGFRFEVGLADVGEKPSHIEIWSGGLQVEVLEAPGVAFRGVLDLDAVRYDVSRMKPVHDETVEAGLAAIETARTQVLERLEREDAEWTEDARPSEWPRARVARVLGRPESEKKAPARPTPPTARRRTTAVAERPSAPLIREGEYDTLKRLGGFAGLLGSAGVSGYFLYMGDPQAGLYLLLTAAVAIAMLPLILGGRSE